MQLGDLGGPICHDLLKGVQQELDKRLGVLVKVVRLLGSLEHEQSWVRVLGQRGHLGGD